MTRSAGFTLPLSLPRRQIGDFLHFASRVPSVTVEKTVQVGPLVEARRMNPHRPGWCSIFTKAWALVGVRHPVLRRAMLSFPWQRLYQHPNHIASIAVERSFEGEEAVFFLQIKKPEEKSLVEIDRRIKWFKMRPAEDPSGVLTRQLRMARMPRLLRRSAWWYGLEANGRLRARFFGTFGVTAHAGGGSQSLNPPGLLTSTLSYGPIRETGEVTVRIIYDHRTLDGSPVSRALATLQEVLRDDIHRELVAEGPPGP
ncbi:MAG: hypothetical protein ACKO23_07765, partial [Gemmataceae bacterium]